MRKPFKTGNRVKVVADDFHPACIGAFGTVVEIRSDYVYCVTVDYDHPVPLSEGVSRVGSHYKPEQVVRISGEMQPVKP